MKKGLLFAVLLLICFSSIDGKCKPKEISSISSGTSFGKCRGYCRQSINITANPNQLTTLKEPNYAQVEYPTVQKQFPFSQEDYQQLVGLVDLKRFQALEERIGCPDCADGGAEWIEINSRQTSKRVTFENGQLIQGFEQLIKKLRELRQQYLN